MKCISCDLDPDDLQEPEKEAEKAHIIINGYCIAHCPDNHEIKTNPEL